MTYTERNQRFEYRKNLTKGVLWLAIIAFGLGLAFL